MILTKSSEVNELIGAKYQNQLELSKSMLKQEKKLLYKLQEIVQDPVVKPDTIISCHLLKMHYDRKCMEEKVVYILKLYFFGKTHNTLVVR